MLADDAADIRCYHAIICRCRVMVADTPLAFADELAAIFAAAATPCRHAAAAMPDYSILFSLLLLLIRLMILPRYAFAFAIRHY